MTDHDNGEYAASLAKFHRTAFNPHKAQDAVVLKEAPLPVLVRGRDESLVEWAKEEEKEKDHGGEDTATGNAASAVAEFPERSQSAVVKDEEGGYTPDPENETQDGLGASIASAAKAGAEVGGKLAQGKVPGVTDEDLIGEDEWSDEAREKAAEARGSTASKEPYDYGGKNKVRMQSGPSTRGGAKITWKSDSPKTGAEAHQQAHPQEAAEVAARNKAALERAAKK